MGAATRGFLHSWSSAARLQAHPSPKANHLAITSGQPARQSPFYASSRTFSIRPALLRDAKSGTESKGTRNPELPTISLEGLGLSKNMRYFIISLATILGTIESWFWCKVIWRWWRGEVADDEHTSAA
ncbi:hypothetical protein B0T17DRAFT_503515 [Bombardia bombarda]|uniref:Uncharacterized protein n=1 Tax=Bombardia bombarda TaxID=252184 RepID=A0AA39XLY0_9PEZI|nr:hypothetical protein B0T17DRAFT_503515 [Bombardia bombarda]